MSNSSDSSTAPKPLSSRASAGRSPCTRLLRRLDAALAADQLYEAHQILRTLHYRLSAAAQHQQVATLFERGALHLLRAEKFESGADLACVLVDTLVAGALPVDARLTDQLARMHALMRAESPERLTFVRKCLTLLQAPAVEHELLAGFSRRLGCTLWTEGSELSAARLHLMRAADGANCGALLVQLHRARCYPSELELVLAQTVLQLLCAPRDGPRAAVRCFGTFVRLHPDPRLAGGRAPFAGLPLLNFVWLLLKAVAAHSPVGVFCVLCEQYRALLVRDAALLGCLDRVGQLHFGLAPPAADAGKPGGGGDLLGNLLSGMFGGAFEEGSAGGDEALEEEDHATEDVD